MYLAINQYVVLFNIYIFKLLFILHSCIYQTSALLWMPDPVERDLIVVKKGLSSETKNLQAATELICSRTPSQKQSFKQQYSRFGVLEDDIYMQASGHHREVIFLYAFFNFSFALLNVSFHV